MGHTISPMPGKCNDVIKCIVKMPITNFFINFKRGFLLTNFTLTTNKETDNCPFFKHMNAHFVFTSKT